MGPAGLEPATYGFRASSGCGGVSTQDGRAEAWESAADMIEDMLKKGNSPELIVRVFRAISVDTRKYADRVNTGYAGPADGHHGERD